MVNAPGWDYLYNGSLIKASYVAYDTAFITGWFVLLLFFVYNGMAIMKTKRVETAFFPSAIFLGMYTAGAYGTAIILPTWIIPIMVIVLVFEIAAMLYKYLFN